MMMSKKIKPVVNPGGCFDHDRENYYIQIELPGVKKKDIQVSISERSLCIKGSRKDIDFLGCWTLAHSVKEEKARAKYDNGLLYVMVPLNLQKLKGKEIPIE